jgi:MtN3 and saliva related transmembrane protein
MTGWDLLVRGLGVGSAVLTSLSYIPQVRKALPLRSTADLSLRTLIALTVGLAGWTLYGVISADPLIAIANTAGAGLAATVLACKVGIPASARSDGPFSRAPAGLSRGARYLRCATPSIAPEKSEATSHQEETFCRSFSERVEVAGRLSKGLVVRRSPRSWRLIHNLRADRPA